MKTELQKLFSLLICYRHNIHMLHWKVSGPSFMCLHKTLDEYVDKFNDFIFGYTSRIPISDIVLQTKELNAEQNDKNKIISPYTLKRKKDNKLKYILIYVFAVVLLVVIVFFIIDFLNQDIKTISDFFELGGIL